MDNDKGDPPRANLGTSIIFQSIIIQRAVRTYNEAHRLLLDYVANFLCNCWKSFQCLFNS